MDKEINKRIKKLRNNTKLTQKQTAALLGIKHSTYSQMERKGGISIDKAARLAEIFNTSVEYIVYGVENVPSEPNGVLIVKDPSPIDEVYPIGQPEPAPEPQPESLILTPLEENMIKIFRSLKKPKRDEICRFFEKFI